MTPVNDGIILPHYSFTGHQHVIIHKWKEPYHPLLPNRTGT